MPRLSAVGIPVVYGGEDVKHMDSLQAHPIRRLQAHRVYRLVTAMRNGFNVLDPQGYEAP
jgi:hypothetical protein